MKLPDPIDSQDIIEKWQTPIAIHEEDKVKSKKHKKQITKNTTGKKSIHTLANRIVKNTRGWDINKSMQCKQKNYVKHFRGTKMRSIMDYIKST